MRLATTVCIALGGLIGWACESGSPKDLGEEGGLPEAGLPEAGGAPDARPDTDPGGHDSGAPTDAGHPDAGVACRWACTPVGRSSSDGFFSLESFGGKLYAGQFGYGREEQSMLYSYPPWELTSPGLTGVGESICAMEELDGALYANTENSGDIFRSIDGSHWDRLYNGGPGTIGCGLAVFGGTLYAVNYDYEEENHGQILRLDGEVFSSVYDSGSDSLYVREIVAYGDMLYAFAVMDEQGRMLSSANGTDWALEVVDNRYFRGREWNGFLWLSSTVNHAAGEVGVFRFDGSEFVPVHADPHRFVTDIVGVGERLFAGTSNGWKDDSGPCSLISSVGGMDGWQDLCTFPETAIWDLAVLDGEVYLGTWDFGGTGQVYRVGCEAIDGVDCSRIAAANPAWEVCESGPAFCAGVFADGAGCAAFCAAVGLPCTARYEGNPGCQLVPIPYGCDEETGHMSDWCECGTR